MGMVNFWTCSSPQCDEEVFLIPTNEGASCDTKRKRGGGHLLGVSTELTKYGEEKEDIQKKRQGGKNGPECYSIVRGIQI